MKNINNYILEKFKISSKNISKNFNILTFDQLKEKAQSLTMQPGVYIMRDIHNDVIYVGKAKKLKNRVSQ